MRSSLLRYSPGQFDRLGLAMTRILILIGLAALLMLGRFVLRSGSRRHRDPQSRPPVVSQFDISPVRAADSDGGEISAAGPFPTGFVEVHVAGSHEGENLRAAAAPVARHFSQPLLLSAAVEIPYQVPLSAFPTKELWDANWPELQEEQDTNRLLRWVDRHGLDRRCLTVGAPAQITRFLLESADPSDLLILPASAKPLYGRMVRAPIGEGLIQRYPGNLLLVEEAGPLLRSEPGSPAIATG